MNFAALDLGTNTFHLIVAEALSEDTYRVIRRMRRVVKIGKGMVEGRMKFEAEKRILDALSCFAKEIQTMDVKHALAVATSAFRNASNKEEILHKISSKTGLHVHIISGQEEARLIWEGVRLGQLLDEKKALLMDIGGGSTEFVVANKKELFWKESIEVGGQKLLDYFQREDPPSESSLARMQIYLHHVLLPLREISSTIRLTKLVGSSGTFSTLIAIHQARHKRQSHMLPVKEFFHITELLRQKDKTQRALMPGMAKERVDMIVVATQLARYVVSLFEVSEITVSPYALKEGLLWRSFMQAKKTNPTEF